MQAEDNIGSPWSPGDELPPGDQEGSGDAAWQRALLRLMADAGYRPMTQHQLAAALKLEGDRRRGLRATLRRLQQTGAAQRLRKNRWALIKQCRAVPGSLRVHPGGYGFVETDNDGEDLFVPDVRRWAALDGDRVLVEPVALPGSRERTAGRLVRVLSRTRQQVCGCLRTGRQYAYIIPQDPRILQNIKVRLPDRAAARWPEEGSVVAVALDPWEQPGRLPTGELREVLGRCNEPGLDERMLLREHGLGAAFSARAEREARGTPPTLSLGIPEERRDLRAAPCFTIDPEEARDFDDAVALQRLENGDCLLDVHIADVAAFCRPGSAIDREAFERGNSVYLVGRALSMLPSRLTCNVCSLQAGKDRLTHTVRLRYNARGQVIESETFPSVIRSIARLDYERVQRCFDRDTWDALPSPVAGMLAPLRVLARRLRRARLRQGALDVQMPETRCLLHADGTVRGFRLRQENEAHQVIEECMLAANIAVAGRLGQRGVPTLYRVHPEPTAEQEARMAQSWRAMGLRPPRKGQPPAAWLKTGDLDAFQRYVAALVLLRGMQRAEYSAQAQGHYGLAVPRYLHFTSPIRRYADLVTHRQLGALAEGRPPPYTHTELEAIARHCSRKEREADEAEQESLAMKRMAYYADCWDRGERGAMEGVVVRRSPRGLIVELRDSLQRGLLPYHTLAGGRAAARRTLPYPPGSRIEVWLARVDRQRRMVTFKPARRVQRIR